MKKWITLMLAMLILGALCAGGLADSEGTIVQSSCNIVRSGDCYLVYCYAQVHNNSGDIICLDRGTFEIASGEQLLYSGEVTQLWPYFIAPGEDGYLFDIALFEPGENGLSAPNVTGIDYNIQYMAIDPAYAGQQLDVRAELVQGAGENELSVVCEISNPTRMDAYGANIALGLYTDSGAMIYADGRALQDVGIPAGGEVLVRFAVDELFVRQWKGYGAEPAGVRATAMFRSGDD